MLFRSRLKDLRARFGPDVILGAGCGASRHLAMTAGEAGADYIGFGALESEEGDAADPEILAWWQAVMTPPQKSEEHTSELQSLMRISYAVFCLKKKKHQKYL